MVRALEAEADRDVARGEIDQAAGNEERADAARALLVQHDRGLVDAAEPADARADQDAGALLLFLGLGLDAGVVDGLLGRRHGVDDERIDLALILDVHPLVGIELAVGVVAERDAVGDLAGDVVDLEIVDALGAALAGEDVGPGGFDAAAEGRDEPHSR